MHSLKKLLDNTPKSVYNICKKDGEGFDLSPISKETVLEETLYIYYKSVRDTYHNNPDLFPTPPVFAGGFFRDILWGRNWPSDLDLFFNSYGMEKEEAEDNLCLFLAKLGYSYEELDNAAYAGLGSMRIFNCRTSRVGEVRCHLQAILKDLGPPKDDPLYVTDDFHYNHGRAALSVVGEPEIHYHGHAVAGKEHKLHVAYREGGMAKCRDKFYGQRDFKQVDFTKQHTTKPKSPVKMPKAGNPCTEIPLEPLYIRQWNEGYFEQAIANQAQPVVNDPAEQRAEQLLQVIRQAQQQRNEFVNQFDPIRNNRRPLP